MEPNIHYMRDPKLVIVTSGSCILFIDDKGPVLEYPTVASAMWSQLLQRLASPVLGHGLSDLLRNLSERELELWSRLIDGKYVLRSSEETELIERRNRIFIDNQGFGLVPQEATCNHLVFACTGSIVSGLIAPTIVSLFYSRFQHQLDVILTQAAQKFITRDLLESYGIRTWGDAFERRDTVYVPHVQLARAADCILVMPASANSLHRLADGACADLLSMTVAATTAPIVLAPVMNTAMWNHVAVQRNVQRLRDDGMFVIEPTLIFGAADVASQGKAMYGGHGTLWAGPGSLIRVLTAILTSKWNPRLRSGT